MRATNSGAAVHPASPKPWTTIVPVVVVKVPSLLAYVVPLGPSEASQSTLFQSPAKSAEVNALPTALSSTGPPSAPGPPPSACTPASPVAMEPDEDELHPAKQDALARTKYAIVL